MNETDVNAKSRMAYELYHHYLRFDLDSIRYVSMELLLDDRSLSGTLSRNMAFRTLGAYLIRKGSLEKGITLLKKSADYFEQKEDYMMASEIYNDIGHGLAIDYELDEARNAYRTSLKLGENSPDPTSAFNALLGLGKVELLAGDTNVAQKHLIDYRIQSLQLNKLEAASDATSLLAHLQLEEGDHSKGLALMREAVELSLKSESRIHHSHAFTNLAIYYFESGQVDSAKLYFQRSLDLREELKNEKAWIEAFYNMGDFYHYTDQKDSAEYYYIHSFDLADKHGFLPDQIDAATALTECLDVNDNKRAFWINRRDSLSELVEIKSGLSDSIINYALSLDVEHNAVDEKQKSKGSVLIFILLTTILASGVIAILKFTN